MAKGDTRRFLGAFFRNPASVGAIAPSSRWLAKAMVEGIDFRSGGSILEFGPGTGAFTGTIERALPEPARYLGIEIDGRFVETLRSSFPALAFVHGSAADAGSIVAERGLAPVLAILSGLPFASLPDAQQVGILGALDHLVGPGAWFRTFQYVHAFGLPKAIKFRRRMGELFGDHDRGRAVLRNLPPAYVLSWRRPPASETKAQTT